MVGGSLSSLARWANRIAYALAHRVLANSASVAELLVRRERVRKRTVAVVPNFLDEDAFDVPPHGWMAALAGDLGLPADRQVVGIVASLSPIKDHATLLRAAAALRRDWPLLHLVFVGADSGSQQTLEALATGLNLTDRVHFAGLRPNQPSPHHLFDISVLTSVSEGLPNSILEAMAARRPVVATAVGAIPDAVIDGETGYLFRAGDDARLCDLIRLLLTNRALARRMGSNGRARARTEYSATSAISRLVTLYHSVVSDVQPWDRR